MDLKKIAADSISGISEALRGEIISMLSIPPDENMGDIALPCFKFAKELRKSPAVIADEFAKAVKTGGLICRAQSLGGYLNIFFDRANLSRAVLSEILSGGEAVFSAQKQEKTICIDYSSINIAKPFHMGHLMTTAIGGSLSRLYKKMGYNVVGINYIGDFGTQFGIMIAAYLKFGNAERVRERGVYELFDYYTRFNAEAKQNEALGDEGREWFRRIESGEQRAVEIFNMLKEITLLDAERVHKRLGVEFESYNGESYYNDKMGEIIDLLSEKGLLLESEGAKVVDLEAFGMPPCLILKKDGSTLYATRDLAAALDRKRSFNFDKSLYVVAYQQNLHFKQFFKVLELLGYEWAKDCEHIAYGMVSLPEGSLSTREGRVAFLEDTLNAAVNKTRELIRAKNPDFSEEEVAQCAEDLGVGAVIFSALSQNKIKDVLFSLADVLSFEGETGTYLAYTHSRCCSVLEKTGFLTGENTEEMLFKADFSLLSNDEEARLIKLLNRFADTVADAVAKNEPSLLSRYLIDLAQAYNKFYFEHRIITPDKPLSTARTALTLATKRVLKEGLRLILLKAPNRM